MSLRTWDEQIHEIVYQHNRKPGADKHGIELHEIVALKAVVMDVIMECYLQCLAVECGEGECAKAIKSKFGLEIEGKDYED